MSVFEIILVHFSFQNANVFLPLQEELWMIRKQMRSYDGGDGIFKRKLLNPYPSGKEIVGI